MTAGERAGIATPPSSREEQQARLDAAYRHCAAVNRTLPTEWDSDSGKYWMKPEIAALFTKARDAA